MTPRVCLDCPASIEHLHGLATRCLKCRRRKLAADDRARKRKRYVPVPEDRRYRGKESAAEIRRVEARLAAIEAAQRARKFPAWRVSEVIGGRAV